ncbi:interleukin-1 receptor accessory protein-like 1-A [Pimephales promelas]|nr:interleukin-1 receptor accessory protein-like 1-A [Pimephales promelas]
MEIIERESVDVANALLVKGLTLTETDDELSTFLQRYGTVKRSLIIDDQTSEFHQHAIVEYAYSSAMQDLAPMLPLTLGSLSNPSVMFQVRALASVCNQTDELQEVHSTNCTPEKVQNVSCDDSREVEMRDLEFKNPIKRQTSPIAFPETTVDGVTVTTRSGFPMNIVDPQGVQKMVVEHIVKSADATMLQQTSIRLKSFSGRCPRPPNEPDFDTWRVNVELLLSDPAISDLQRVRKILDSLLSPAADVVKHVRPPALPAVYLELLESVYGSVEDGDELLAKFMGTLQNQGSQVTTIPQSFYESHLSDHPLKSLGNLLEVEGANGQAVPYLGYIELVLKFPKEFVGAEIEIPTLALVVPDLKSLSQVLVGTNSLDVLYGHCINEKQNNPCSDFHGYQAVLRVLEARWRQAGSEPLGHVKLMGNMPEVVPAGNTVVLNGYVQFRKPCLEKLIALEPPSTPAFCGLSVASCVHTLPSRRSFQLSVLLKNDTRTDVMIPPKAILAEIHAVEKVIESTKSPCGVESSAPTSANLTFDFGDSPLPSHWKERISNRLNSMPEVFSLHDLDFGRTSQDGVKTDPAKVEALKTWPRPTNLKELRAFLGFAGYYRRFVRDYSKIVKPLTGLTEGYPPLRRGRSGKREGSEYFNTKEQFGDRWTDACQNAFDDIISKLTSAPVLGFADPRLPYTLHTDASTTGLGAALYQEQDGQMRVIAFASRGLTKSEAKYPAHKLEFLALKWAVTTKFSDYLYGTDFTVVTDSNPLTYVLTSAKLDATSYRWLSSLSTYTFKLQYRAGSQNQDADGLSRRPHGEPLDDLVSQKERERIEKFTLHHLADPENKSDVLMADVVKAICERHQELQHETEHGLPSLPNLSEAALAEWQEKDPELKVIVEWIRNGTKPGTLRGQPSDLVLWLREWGRFELKNGVLYRKKLENGVSHYQLVLPVGLRDMVLRSLHDDMGHLGIERTLDLVRSRFFWPRMSQAVEKKIKTCERCVRRKRPPDRAAPLGAETEISCEDENRNEENLVLTEARDVEGSPNERENNTEFEEGAIPRRSQRERKPAKRLEYPQLGNPLTVVIQSLLQGLSVAFSTALEEKRKRLTLM